MKTKEHLQGVFIPCSAENVNSIINQIRTHLGYMCHGVSADCKILSKAINDFEINFDKK